MAGEKSESTGPFLTTGSGAVCLHATDPERWLPMLTPPRPLKRARLDNRLQVTVQARRAIADLSRTQGRQHVVVTWPAGAALLPEHVHEPAPHEAIVGHLAQCPIYVDLRQVAVWPNRWMVLDVTPERRWRGARPCFVLVEHAGRETDRPAREVVGAH